MESRFTALLCTHPTFLHQHRLVKAIMSDEDTKHRDEEEGWSNICPNCQIDYPYFTKRCLGCVRRLPSTLR